MANIAIPDTSATPGLVAQGSDTITAVDIALITGNEPAYMEEDMTVALSQTLAAYTVVGLDGSGDIIPAVLGTTAAIGITLFAVTTPGSGAKKAVPILRAACVNPDKLVWDATYNTVEKKLEAFRGAPSPTDIIVRPIKTATVV